MAAQKDFWGSMIWKQIAKCLACKRQTWEKLRSRIQAMGSVALLEWKTGGGCGAKEKSRGANINVSLAWWFSVTLKIDLLWWNVSNPTQACEYRQNRRQKVIKSFKIVGWKLSAVYVNQKKLNVKLRKKRGGITGPAKNLGGHDPPRPPLRTTTAWGDTRSSLYERTCFYTYTKARKLSLNQIKWEFWYCLFLSSLSIPG